MGRGACQATVHGVAKTQTQRSNFTFTFHFHVVLCSTTFFFFFAESYFILLCEYSTVCLSIYLFPVFLAIVNQPRSVEFMFNFRKTARLFSKVAVPFCIPTRRRRWQPTPVLLPGKSHGWRSLVGCSPWGRYESDVTERLHFHFSLSCIGEGNGNPLQCSCLENPRDGGAWWAAIYGVAQIRTRLKRLSSSSNSIPTSHV